MPRGGARTGAGRKPKPRHLRGIDGGAGRRGPRPIDDAETAPLAEPSAIVLAPAHLTDAELAVWNEWAPDAIAKGTLTKENAATFGHLCEVEVDRRNQRSRYVPQRAANAEILPLLFMSAKEELSVRRLVIQLTEKVTSMRKDFMLAPIGKEIIAPGAAEPKADPIDRFMRK